MQTPDFFISDMKLLEIIQTYQINMFTYYFNRGKHENILCVYWPAIAHPSCNYIWEKQLLFLFKKHYFNLITPSHQIQCAQFNTCSGSVRSALLGNPPIRMPDSTIFRIVKSQIR